MQSFDFQVVLDCPLTRAFAIYVDVERWRNRNHFGEIWWAEGRPWQKGSRLRVETRTPIRAHVDHIVEQFSANECVVYWSELFGVTCETRVTFTPVSDRQCAINIVMEIVGAPPALNFALAPAIAQATAGFFEELRRECAADTLIGTVQPASRSRTTLGPGGQSLQP